jgi:DNA repair protein RecN (Recombination protein N)
MLLELRVENLLLIEQAELRLAPGLNVVTGETGAGKTVLAHALDLLLGGKPRSGIVRPGADEAYVEGLFAAPPGALDGDELSDLRERLADLSPGDEIVLGRRVSASGRSRAFVQGRAATAADLRELGGRLVSFYGQHEHRRLTLSSAQMEVLDGFGGAQHLALRERYAAAHAKAQALRRRLEELHSRAGARERDLDLLVFELEEIDALQPSEHEEEELRGSRERLRHVEGLRAAAGAAAEALAPDAPGSAGAASLAAAGERALDASSGVDPELDGLAERLRTLLLEAEDLGGELRRYIEALDAEPGRLEEVEQRLDLYERLERKHGGSVAAVLAHAERCRAERARLEGAEVALGEAESELRDAGSDEAALAAELSEAREGLAPELAKRVLAELSALAMEDAELEVLLEPRDELGPGGRERVQIVIAPNPGVPAAPLREIASGGELSRVMLALMGVAAGGGKRFPARRPTAGTPGTLVFDEVDAGVGGQTARAVGERLRDLSEQPKQVVCITHLPQIASLADAHFRVEKTTSGELAAATVEPLTGDGVVEELCRMLGADGGDAGARRHAEELLAAA